MADVLVLGAGMIGVCTALQLVKRGHSVTLLDRREPGRETSYGNAGLIQREAVEPYEFPHDLRTLVRVALGGGFDVNYHLRDLPQLAAPLAAYWRNSGPARYPTLARHYASLIEHCIAEHAPLIEEAGAEELVGRSGWLEVYRSDPAFDEARGEAQRVQQTYGVEQRLLDRYELAAAEPGLRSGLAGAIHWTQPWSIRNPGELVTRYAALFEKLGGRLVRGDAGTLRQAGAGWRVDSDDGVIDAAHAVVALGPWSARLAGKLGYRIPLFVKRGYHRHYRGQPLQQPILDAERGYLAAPMQRGLRITSGAEFAALDARATPTQLFKAERAAAELLELGEPVELDPWRGARPCLPDMNPVIGAAPRDNGLWFHFGHAHQGFTLGPASGRLLAEMIDGQTPYIDPTPFAPSRFSL